MLELLLRLKEDHMRVILNDKSCFRVKRSKVSSGSDHCQINSEKTLYCCCNVLSDFDSDTVRDSDVLLLKMVYLLKLCSSED